MATTPKINYLDNDRESLKDALPKELTEKLKDYVNTHATSESSKRLNALIQASQFDALTKTSAHSIALDAIKKASELNVLNQTARLNALSKTSALNIALDALKKSSALDDLSKTYVHRIALDTTKKVSELATLNQLAAIRESQNTLVATTSKALLSLNLYPMKSFESKLKNINYPTSIEQALTRDWRNVGNDLWKSYLTISGIKLSDNDE